MNPLLELDGVSKSFGGVRANTAIDLAVGEGEIVGLIGPNGSGKTTLFNSIAGHHPIDAGSIRFAGQEISRLRVPQIARRGIIRTFQQTRVYRRMTCMQNMVVSAPVAAQGIAGMLGRIAREDGERAQALLDFVGLAALRHSQAGDLSFGQQRLLEFAMALMRRPRLLLLDEPTAGINPTLINGVIDRLRRANAELQVTLLVIEHNMRVIMNLAQRLYCMSHGEMLAAGTPGEVRNDPRVLAAYLGGS
ncbi:MAG: transporter ATP-binding protein [Rhodospirillales bacterium]|nr:transporter ATP-binding protein [Rhodospirillales bacterium]